jgi:hypothetical protein
MSLPPVHGTLDVMPTFAYSTAAADCGFANYNIFGNATVRSVPLYVEYQNRLYPQFGLAMACMMLGADPAKVRIDGSKLIIPAPSGPIEIPTYVYHSKAMGTDVPLIVPVSWFGTGDWEKMYDWPAHRTGASHYSLANVFSICETRDAIVRNNASIDLAISHVLDDDRPDKLQVDPRLGKKYAASRPAPEDTVARESRAATTLEELKAAGWLEAFDQMQEKDMTPLDRLSRDKLHDAYNTLKISVAQNKLLQAQVETQRRQLVEQIGGKGVLIGFTATGFLDQVATSLHSHAPGVVVHGVIANAVLTGRWWRMAPPWVTIWLTLFLGLITAAAQGWFHPIGGSLIALALAAAYWLINGLLLFGYFRWIVGVASPMITIIAVWGTCTLFRVILEGLERIRISAENDIFQKEMALARKVQFALIPKEPPQMDGINADGWTMPADSTGGDCYDLWKLPDGRLGVLVADASGHGLAPAMIVSQVRTLVHMLSEYELHPHALLKRVNSRLALDLEVGRFVTAFLAFLNSDGEIHWASAGHGPILWAPTGDGQIQELAASGLPLGVQEDWMADEPGPPLQLGQSGRLIVLSDGIFEALSPTRDLWSTDPVKDILHKERAAASAELIVRIRDAVQAWQKKVEPNDDQTIVIVRRVAAAEASSVAAESKPIQ